MKQERPWWLNHAMRYARADFVCGRAWSCGCGACTTARARGWKPPIQTEPRRKGCSITMEGMRELFKGI